MQRRFEPYKSSLDIDQDSQHGLDDLSSWSLDENMKRILYDTNAMETNHHQKKSNIKGATLMNTNKKRVTIKDTDQDTLADLDADYMFDNLLEDEKENEKVFQNILNDLSHIERKERQLLNREEEEADDYDDDYVDQVSIDDLLGGIGGGGGSESVMSSFIDWDQIDQLVDTLK